MWSANVTAATYWQMHGNASEQSIVCTISSTAPRLIVLPTVTARCSGAGAVYVLVRAAPFAHSGLTASSAVPGGKSKPVRP